MLDIKQIREKKEDYERLLGKRGESFSLDRLIRLDEEKRQIDTLIQQFQQAKNKKSKKLASLRGTSGNNFEEVKRDVEHINEKLSDLNNMLNSNDELKRLLENLPNTPQEEVPNGKSEEENVEISRFMEPNNIQDALEHFDLGQRLGLMDFEQTAKISGSRFVTLKGGLARLERALINFMIDNHTRNFDYKEISAPILVRNKAMYNVGQLPKFADDSYETAEGDMRLIPTGEVSLTNLVADMILHEEELPKKFTCYSPCFRKEAGSAGRDTRGMIRNHQFGKVELVSITKPEDSEKEHQIMLKAAEDILQKLELPYRVMLLCAGDMGFSASKTYDIEVWLPGQKKYREISSVSNCQDFQARRLKARYKEKATQSNKLVHTLNGSGLAVGRTIVAIMENYQNPDRSITVPKVLIPYMGGESKIGKDC